MNKEDLIKKYEGLEGVWNANGAEIARQCFLRDLEQLNEIDTKKVTVPQFVADWIKKSKNWKSTLYYALDHSPEKVILWLNENEANRQNTFARAWLDGYTVEKEKRYRVTVKNILTRVGTLNRNKKSKNFIFSNPEENSLYDTKFTRKELEQDNFGWVFDCPGAEIEEVEE